MLAFMILYNLAMEQPQIEQIKNWLGTGSINIFGMPFAGKDTQAKRLAKTLDADLIQSGEIIRQAALSSEGGSARDSGELAPQDEYLATILPYLKSDDYKDRRLILSSLGRWDGEQQVIMQACADSGHPLKAVVLLKITPQEAEKRWQAHQTIGDRGQRADDSSAAFQKRFDVYKTKTLPVIEYYRDHGLLIEIDGLPDVDTVTEMIQSALLERLGKPSRPLEQSDNLV